MTTQDELESRMSYHTGSSAEAVRQALKEPLDTVFENLGTFPPSSRPGAFSKNSKLMNSISQSVNTLSQTIIPLLSPSSSMTTSVPTTIPVALFNNSNGSAPSLPSAQSNRLDPSPFSIPDTFTISSIDDSPAPRPSTTTPEHPFFNTTSPSPILIPTTAANPSFSSSASAVATSLDNDSNPRASLDSMQSAQWADLPNEDELGHDASDEDADDDVDADPTSPRYGPDGSVTLFQDAREVITGGKNNLAVAAGKEVEAGASKRSSVITVGERDGRSILVIEDLSAEAQECVDQDFRPTPFSEQSDPFTNGIAPNSVGQRRGSTSSDYYYDRSQFFNRNQRRFQRCFPEIASEAIALGEWYTCAMERDILWQGQIFCTSHYVCFYGKLFAKAVRVMIHFQDVVRIEKMNSLVVIPNALRVGTSTKQYVFTSFLSRDNAFAEIHDAWWRFRHVGSATSSTHSLSDDGFRSALSDANAPGSPSTSADNGRAASQERNRSNSDAAFVSALSDASPYADDPPRTSSQSSRLLRAAAASAIAIPSFGPKRRLNRPRADSEATTASEGAASGAEDRPVVVLPQPQASNSTPVKANRGWRKHQGLIGIQSSVTALVNQFAAGSGGEEEEKGGLYRAAAAAVDGNRNTSLSARNKARARARSGVKAKREAAASSLVDGLSGHDFGTAAVTAPPIVTVTQAQAQVSIGAGAQGPQAQSVGQDKRAQFGEFMKKAKLPGLGGSAGRPTLGFAAAAFAGANSVMQQQREAFKRQRAAQTVRAGNELAEEGPGRKEKVDDGVDGVDGVDEIDGIDDEDEMQDAMELDGLSESESESELDTDTDVSTDDEEGSSSLVTRVTPSPVPPPADPIPCGCTSHPKHLLGEWVFPVPLATLHNLIWGNDMTLVWEPCHTKRESKNLKFGEWTVDGQGRPLRLFDYYICMHILFQKSWTLCKEEQTIEKDTDYVKVIGTISRQPEVPMGNTFEVNTQICLTHEGPGKSRMKVTLMLDWKSFNFMAGGFDFLYMQMGKIERTAVENTADYFREFAATINEFIKNNPDHPYLVNAGQAAAQAQSMATDAKEPKLKVRRKKNAIPNGEAAEDLLLPKVHIHTTSPHETARLLHHRTPSQHASEVVHSIESGVRKQASSSALNQSDKRKGPHKHAEVTTQSSAGPAVGATAVVPASMPAFTELFASSSYPIFKLFCSLFIGLVNLLRSARDRRKISGGSATVASGSTVASGEVDHPHASSTRTSETEEAWKQRRIISILLFIAVVMLFANLWNMWTFERRVMQSVVMVNNNPGPGFRPYDALSNINGDNLNRLAAYLSEIEEAANRHHHARLDALTRHIHARLTPLRAQAAQLQQEVSDVLRILDEVLMVQEVEVEATVDWDDESAEQYDDTTESTQVLESTCTCGRKLTEATRRVEVAEIGEMILRTKP
ncbi:hypothetical protein BC937DRAFT_91256 [Endogone sp. FLAS-F59071]|nr:hypothetical protein BC937DRAFT_91256 [Endogone sp. FLAS-F59071]|eukprot:RUS16400.1 hypothetical protein BC937DRAFT_91256 [Endogone sp. FLAS-F59071]